MESNIPAYSEFSATAATATTLMVDFLRGPRVSEPPRVDVQRIARLQELADVLEKGLCDVEHALEQQPSLTILQSLKSALAALREQYSACWKSWREEGERGQTPPVLWARLQHVNKALTERYQDVCDLIFFEEAKEEEAELMPPGKLEDLVQAAHQEGRH